LFWKGPHEKVSLIKENTSQHPLFSSISVRRFMGATPHISHISTSLEREGDKGMEGIWR